MKRIRYIKKRKHIKLTKLIIGIVIGVLISGLSIWYGSTILIPASSVGYDNTNSGLTSDNLQDAIREVSFVNSVFNNGDYFTLVPDAATATTSTPGFSGSTPTSDQTLWKVININNDGTVDAISEYVSSGEVTISGVNGYKNIVAGLEDIASKYAKSGYTVATRNPGYNGQTLSLPSTSAFDGTSTTLPCNDSDFPEDYDAFPGMEINGGICGDTLTIKDELLIRVARDICNNDDCYYDYDKYGNIKNYWNSGRIYVYDDPDMYYSVYAVSASHYERIDLRYYYEGTWYNGGEGPQASEWYFNYAGVRPIITLRPGITIASGSGTKASPYILN